MNNPYLQYYVNQAGSGLSGFRGMRVQKGYGFFSVIAKTLLPFLKSAGKTAAREGVRLAKENITTDHLKTLGKAGTELAFSALKQSGSGRRSYKRRRRRFRSSIGRRMPKRKAARRKRIVKAAKLRRKKTTSTKRKAIKCAKRRRRRTRRRLNSEIF